MKTYSIILFLRDFTSCIWKLVQTVHTVVFWVFRIVADVMRIQSTAVLKQIYSCGFFTFGLYPGCVSLCSGFALAVQTAGICPSSRSPRTAAPLPLSLRAYSLKDSIAMLCIIALPNTVWSKHFCLKSQVLAYLEMKDSVLTELFANDGGLAEHHSPHEEVDMTEDDERRRGSRPTVVLLN